MAWDPGRATELRLGSYETVRARGASSAFSALGCEGGGSDESEEGLGRVACGGLAARLALGSARCPVIE